MRLLLILLLLIIILYPVQARQDNNTTKLAEEIVNTTSKLLERLKKKQKEFIEWEILDKTEHTEYYIPKEAKKAKNFSISIITKREKSKVALAYSDYVRFLYDTMYITAINKNNTTLVFKFVSNVDTKTLEFDQDIILLKVKFDDDVKKLSMFVIEKETGKELFNFTNITILHKTYERHVTEKVSTIEIEKWAYYSSKVGYFLAGIAEAFIVSLIVLKYLKKRKEDTILVGW